MEKFFGEKLDKKALYALQEIGVQLQRIADGGNQSGGDNTAIMQKLEEMSEIMANDRQEVQARFDTLKAQVAKVGDDLAAFVATLRAEIAAGSDLSDVVTDLDETAAALQAVDDTIPERPAPEPEPAPVA